MTSERRIEVKVEVPATPAEVWAAIATGPGITAWFMPADVEGAVGGSVVHRPAPDMPSTGTVTAYDGPHRFAYEEPAPIAEGEEPARPIATEFLVEARGGGTCVVRIVQSGFGEGDAWDRAIESFTTGWKQALLSLRLYLTRFRGESAAPITVATTAPGPKDAVWSALARALGVPAAPERGQRITITAAGAPGISGTVEEAADGILTLALDEPARGLGLIGVGGIGDDEVFVTIRAQLFGPGAAQVAAREQDRWATWLSQRMAPAR
jgi:uncharacterized protein YndB with AHSA1/START domain